MHESQLPYPSLKENALTFAIHLKWKKLALITALNCLSKNREESKITPRFLIYLRTLVESGPNWASKAGDKCAGQPNIKTSVLFSFNCRKLLDIHVLISCTHQMKQQYQALLVDKTENHPRNNDMKYCIFEKCGSI